MRDKLINNAYYTPVIMAIIVILLLIGKVSQAQTKEQIYRYCVTIGIKKPKIVTAQALYETAHLTSNVFKENNNLFGMKVAKQRITTAINENRGFAVYENWKESINDYLIYQTKYYKAGNYYDFLNSHGYSTNPKYCETLKKMKIN